MREIRLRVSDEIYYRILLLMEQKSSSKNALINSALFEYFNKESDEKLLKENSDCKLSHTIQIKASDAEFNLLKDRAKAHGFKAAAKELRFILINTLYANKFFSNLEMSKINLATSEFKRLGKNFYEAIELFKYKKGSSFEIKFDELKQSFTDILEAIEIYKECVNAMNKERQKRLWKYVLFVRKYFLKKLDLEFQITLEFQKNI